MRANSKLTSSEYCMPVLGIIFLRHATNRYNAAVAQIEADRAAGKMAKRPLIQADFLKRRALMLPREARYDEILTLPKGSNLGSALVEAMHAIERSFVPLLNQLPKDYDKFENDLLENILRIFDSETLRTATGDVFGRIYESFVQSQVGGAAQPNANVQVLGTFKFSLPSRSHQENISDVLSAYDELLGCWKRRRGCFTGSGSSASASPATNTPASPTACR